MKKTVTREVDCCDECGDEVSYEYSCMKCGAIYCYAHSKNQMVSYSHGVYIQGSGDGHYCKKCDAELKAKGDDPLFASYLAVEAVRAEAKRVNTDFEQRRKFAEMRCETEYKKWKAANQ